MQGEPEFYGAACECDDSRCGRVDGFVCSGRGTCTCDGCQCNVEPTTNMPYVHGDDRACECTPATNCVDPRNKTVRISCQKSDSIEVMFDNMLQYSILTSHYVNHENKKVDYQTNFLQH